MKVRRAKGWAITILAFLASMPPMVASAGESESGPATGEGRTVLAAAGAGDSLEVPQLLAAMRENDARFDHLELRYTRFVTERIQLDPFTVWRFGGDVSKMTKEDLRPYTVNWVFSRGLVVSGDDLVGWSQYEPELSAKGNRSEPSAYNKWGLVGDLEYELCDSQLPDDHPSKLQPRFEKQLTVKKRQRQMGWLHDGRMLPEFTFGIGFGRRMAEITSLNVISNGFLVTGQIRIWIGRTNQVELLLDADRLVRRATIRHRRDGVRECYEVSTEGTVRQGGLVLARSGSYRDTREFVDARGVVTGKCTNECWRVEFKSVETGLSAEQFAERAAFKLEPLMQFDDFARGLHGTGARREDGSVYLEAGPDPYKDYDAPGE